MVGSGPHQAESMGSQREDHFVNLERRRNRDVSVHTTHTSRSQSRNGSHLSHEEDTKALQLKIDHLKRKLCHERRRRTPSCSDFSSDDERRYRSLPSKGLGNDAMSTALNQISKSPFMRKIERAKLPWWFNQPTFTIYNNWTDPVEHVSHFNQRMTVHSKNEALMCKVFPSSLGPIAMR